MPLHTDFPISPPAADTLQAPTLRRRLACWVYEGMLLFGVVFIAGYLFSSLTQTRHALDNRHEHQAFVFVVLGIYFTWLWAKGQTLAMKTWRIRVVDARGQPLRQSRALVRYLLSWVWILPPLVVAWALDLHGTQPVWFSLAWVVAWAWSSRLQSEGQYWHDIWAGTRLVNAN